jgi:hypothetical protein
MVALVMNEVIDNLGVAEIKGLGFHLLIGRERGIQTNVNWSMLYNLVIFNAGDDQKKKIMMSRLKKNITTTTVCVSRWHRAYSREPETGLAFRDCMDRKKGKNVRTSLMNMW